MSEHSRQQHSVQPADNSQPNAADPPIPSTKEEPEPDVDVKAPKFQYLTEGFDPALIEERQ